MNTPLNCCSIKTRRYACLDLFNQLCMPPRACSASIGNTAWFAFVASLDWILPCSQMVANRTLANSVFIRLEEELCFLSTQKTQLERWINSIEESCCLKVCSTSCFASFWYPPAHQRFKPSMYFYETWLQSANSALHYYQFQTNSLLLQPISILTSR